MIHGMFLGHPDPLVSGTDLDPFYQQAKKVLFFDFFMSFVFDKMKQMYLQKVPISKNLGKIIIFCCHLGGH
jgi:hypothetical protein